VFHALIAAALASPADTLSAELDRAAAAWAGHPSAPYFVALALTDEEVRSLGASAGHLTHDVTRRRRWLDTDVRTGDVALDSTHALRGFSSLGDSDRTMEPAPLEDGFALRHQVARSLDRAVRAAAERLVLVRANLNVKVEEEDPAPDFSTRPPVFGTREVPQVSFDEVAWAERLRALSALLDAEEALLDGSARLDVRRATVSFVDSDGSRVEHGTTSARVTLHATTVAPDGDAIDVVRTFDAHIPERLPDEVALRAAAREVRAELVRRRDAARGEPYSGPVLLSGRAAAVFVHEVLGHRAESHRQKRDDEGKTFADLVGQPVLPPFLDIADDPGLSEWEGTDLNGWYLWDDEGTPAAPAPLVDDGRMVGFLTTRSPIQGFPSSNGHARRSTGAAPLARMGNTITTASQAHTEAELRRRLLAEARRQGLAFAYLVDEIDGGFTMTGRVTPNAFNVRASSLRRIWVDGRPDEPVRGLDLVGTPLAAFQSVLAAGDQPEVFNGICGAESGWVPVSAVAPPLLFQRLEFQLKEKAEERPPLLPRPATGGDT
jgi:predicted Zn-dependent protease